MHTHLRTRQRYVFDWCLARQCSYASFLSGSLSLLKIPPMRRIRSSASKPNEWLFGRDHALCLTPSIQYTH